MVRSVLVNLGGGLAGRRAPGEGDAVLWIHGYTLNSTCWAELWERLPDWNHISLDLPGHGCSMPLNSNESLSELAQRVGSMAVERDVRHLVGFSFGAILALQIELEFPDTFTTLTLASPFLGGGPFGSEIRSQYRAVKALFAKTGYGPNITDLWMTTRSLFGSFEPCAKLRNHLRSQVSRHPWWELKDDSYGRLWHTPQALRDLRKVEAATLIILGGDDGVATQQCAFFLERTIRGAQRYDLPGQGHLCFLEQPERIQQRVEEHWRAYTVGSGGPKRR